MDVPVVDGGPDKLDLDIDYFQLGGTYLWDGKRAQPFMVATLGAAHLNPDGSGDSETYFAFSIGGGWRLFPAERFGLRVEGRFYGTVLDSDSDIFCRTGPENNQCLIQSQSEILWQWQMLLEPGAVIFIDNHRILHGRTAFSGPRRIAGCYLSGPGRR